MPGCGETTLCLQGRRCSPRQGRPGWRPERGGRDGGQVPGVQEKDEAGKSKIADYDFPRKTTLRVFRRSP